MARKNIFNSVMRDDVLENSTEEEDVPVTRFGAAKSLSSSLDALAKQAERINEGDVVLELDPDQLDASFVRDRLGTSAVLEDEEYRELVNAIRDRGQDSPILVRPDPKNSDRYMIVFGHRRAQAAKDLGRKVRAVIRQLDEQAHVISQGQENSARSNLSFIERALFADRLERLGYSREVIQAALSIDYQTLSKMLTIPSAFGEDLIEAIGPAKGVGRDRWLQLRKLIDVPKNKALAEQYVTETEFLQLPQANRFEAIFSRLKTSKGKSPVKKAENVQPRQVWSATDDMVTVSKKATPKAVTLVLSSSNGVAFGDWITKNLGGLYETFQKQTETKE
ncbi:MULTISPECIES: plasmid partitioning protein RepB [unclassified Agrobacterium]|uniref:plasmid partitioning protein RepB n=1 Tax=unclassified Agrobacterium TaxID=2632611 RepID=UPI002446CEAF|nr:MULTISPECIES: plasmid partitioning protein RepB [unclassified Agrobacterium]MDH0615640.1 plasmid partitioning protein RepB [Agrobacterium sp. GD03872]MDH0698779.1 plasmid partitioning protein RepB [Agrobacterium sp. GD03871]MDH1061452.1 plasmid partitioning protein RepB [Agrobacterium sp. GD03992]MDH2212613.1 plasmid partitioning protein RepB [Agrobacterium sp. GD03643]MDH2221034.1 plasmid partitioning protein RepB [Agrobacterium sp. GD03638]